MITNHSTAARRFFDWTVIRWSRNTRVDGLWVGVFVGRQEKEILGRLVEALVQIKTYDPYRYRRVLREIERILAYLLPGHSAVWLPALKRCVVDPRFILSASPQLIASAIVHEATHAALNRRHIGYAEPLRERVEKVCMHQELAFALKIPDGDQLRESIRIRLASATSDWLSDAALRERRINGEFEMARHANIPGWVMGAIQSIRERTLSRQR